jgi:SH3-like domain-containing protein
MVSTFGWLTPYAVYNIVSSDVLNVRTGAGVTYPIATTLAYDKKNVFRTGSKATASSAEWWEIYKPEGGKGWVNASYLTEYRSTANVCADTRVNTLLTNFAAAVKSTDGAALSNLVSPKHGLAVRYSAGTVAPVVLSKSAVAGIFTSTTSYNWGVVPGSGTNAVGTFKNQIQPKLLEVLNAAYQTTCNDFSHVGPVTHPWPGEYTNITSYALYKPGTPGTELDWRTWIAGIEYVDGAPYIVALVQYQWEP